MSDTKTTRPTLDIPACLRERSAYPDPIATPVVVHETHISWVFLAGDFAYKVKKPIKNEFLDYSSLDRRRHFCHEELRLDSRFAEGLYLGVVPITFVGHQLSVDGRGEPVEYAVKMHRFSEEGLLSHQLQQDRISREQVWRLADRVATFHAAAARCDPQQPWGACETVVSDAQDNLDHFKGSRFSGADDRSTLAADLNQIGEWTDRFAEDQKLRMTQRVANGFIRECHGDLHLDNVVEWRGRMVPFDGIEFNDRYRWIDVLSDAAFLSMDFAARGRADLGNSFANAYLETTGDHASLPLWRWYFVYRAMVRAKVAAIRAAELEPRTPDHGDAVADCMDHARLARAACSQRPARLWITHGLSGSGKTYRSEAVVQREGAIRLRSDIERKRHYGLSSCDHPDPSQCAALYSERANHATYGRLIRLTRSALKDGFSVIVDAAFLQRDARDRFRSLARSMGAGFAILDCQADEATLRKRVCERQARGADASDATLDVLEHQIATEEPLTADESRLVDCRDRSID